MRVRELLDCVRAIPSSTFTCIQKEVVRHASQMVLIDGMPIAWTVANIIQNLGKATEMLVGYLKEYVGMVFITSPIAF